MCVKSLVLSFVSRLSLWYWLRRFDCTLKVFTSRFTEPRSCLVGFDPKHCWPFESKTMIPQRSAVVEIGCNVCRSSPGESVDLLCLTICTTVVASDWCITNLTHVWWVWSKAFLALCEEENEFSVVRCGRDQLSCLIVGIHASGMLLFLRGSRRFSDEIFQSIV